MKQLLKKYSSRARGWFLSLSPVKKDVLVFVATVLGCWFYLFIMSNVKGTFHRDDSSKYIAFWEDIAFHISWLAMVPLGMAILQRNRRLLKNLQGHLAAQGMCTHPLPAANLFRRSLLLSVAYTVILAYAVRDHLNDQYWWTPQVSGSYVLILHFLSCCVLTTAITIMCLSYAETFAKEIRRQLAQHRTLVIEVYHPDGCGGLYWISKPFLNLTAVCIPMFLMGLATVAHFCWSLGYTWRNPVVLWSITWPTIFGPFVTFLIVKSTGIRKYLIEDKRRRLSVLSQRISNELARVLPPGDVFMTSEKAKDEDGRWARVITMMDLYAKLEKAFPVWPIPRRVIGLAASVGPAISLLSSLIAIASALS